MKHSKKSKIIAIITLLIIIISTTPLKTQAKEEPAMDAESIQMINMINTERASLGLSQLQVDPILYNYTIIRAAESTQVFSHTRPDGSPYYSINPNLIWGELLAYGYGSADMSFNALKNDPPHYYVMTNPNFNKIGVYHIDDHYAILLGF
jgi:uncharacterized protein YkwD